MAEPSPKIKASSVTPPATRVPQKLQPVAGLSNSTTQVALDRHRSLVNEATLSKPAPSVPTEAMGMAADSAKLPADAISSTGPSAAPESGGHVSTFSDATRPAGEQGASAKRADPAASEQDIAGNVRWHLQIEPGSGVIQKDTLLTIWLRNTEGVRGDFLGGWPRVTLRTAIGRTQPMLMEGPPSRDLLQDARGYRLQCEVHEPGPLEIVVDATPNGAYGGLKDRMTPLRLVTRVDVVERPTDKALAGTSAAERQEKERIEDPSASPGAMGQAFRRAATRRAIEIVNGNLAEAEELKKLYTNSTIGPEEMAGLAEAVAVDLRLETEQTQRVSELERLRERAKLEAQLVPEYGPTQEQEDRVNEVAIDVTDAENAVAALDEARGLLVETVPAFGLLRFDRQQRKAVASGGPEQQAAIMATLDKLIADCETTRTALASGRLDAMRSGSFVAEMRAELGINADARRSAAVDAMLDQRRSEAFDQMVGMFGVNLLLLLVPGVGPFLSVAVSGIGAGLAWREALDVRAAAGAGVMSDAEASGATLDAVLETLLAALDIVLALKALKHIKVPKARFRGRVQARTALRKAQRKPPTSAVGPTPSETVPSPKPGFEKLATGPDPSGKDVLPAMGPTQSPPVSWPANLTQALDEPMVGRHPSFDLPSLEDPRIRLATRRIAPKTLGPKAKTTPPIPTAKAPRPRESAKADILTSGKEQPLQVLDEPMVGKHPSFELPSLEDPGIRLDTRQIAPKMALGRKLESPKLPEASATSTNRSKVGALEHAGVPSVKGAAKGLSRLSPDAMETVNTIFKNDAARLKRARASLQAIKDDRVIAWINRYHRNAGFEDVLKDYVIIRGNKQVGARFMMQDMIDDTIAFPPESTSLTMFEVPDLRRPARQHVQGAEEAPRFMTDSRGFVKDPTVARISDVWVAGRRTEYKSVREIRSGAAKQLENDIIAASAGNTWPEVEAELATRRWVFNAKKMERENLTKADVVNDLCGRIFGPNSLLQHHPHEIAIRQLIERMVEFH